MTMSELADKLEEYESKGLMESLWTVMALNIPEITKSLRFAADMERLAREDVIFINQMAGEVWMEGFGFSVVGSDIYSAAREAVESLEGLE